MLCVDTCMTFRVVYWTQNVRGDVPTQNVGTKRYYLVPDAETGEREFKHTLFIGFFELTQQPIPLCNRIIHSLLRSFLTGECRFKFIVHHVAHLNKVTEA